MRKNSKSRILNAEVQAGSEEVKPETGGQSTEAKPVAANPVNDATAENGALSEVASPVDDGARGAEASKVEGSRGGGDEKKRTYEDLFRATNPEPRNPEHDEKLRRRMRGRALISGIGDGISALSNLFFTSRYAPNVEQPAKLSEGVQRRLGTMMERYNRERDAYNAGLQRARDKDAEDARWEKNWRLKLQELKDKNDNDKANRDAANERAAKKLAHDEAQAKQKRDADKAKLEEQKRHNKAQEGIGWTRAKNANGGSRYPIRFLGKEYKNEAEYKAAVQKYVKENEYVEGRDAEGKKTDNGGINPKKKRHKGMDTEEVYKSIDELAGEAEAHYEKRKAEEAERRAPHRQKADAAEKAPYLK